VAGQRPAQLAGGTPAPLPAGSWKGDGGIGLSRAARAFASVWLVVLLAGGRGARAQEPGPLPGTSPLTGSSDLS